MKTISVISQWRIANPACVGGFAEASCQLPMACRSGRATDLLAASGPYGVTRPTSSIVNRLPRRSEAKAGKSKIVNGSAFTLVEMLVVISIIGILAALLLPALSAARVDAQKKQARLQISDLVTAIQNYDSAYSRLPISTAAQQAAMNNGGMFTYGGVFQTPSSGPWPASIPANYYPSNNEVIAILMDITNTTVTAVNANHQKNPQQTLFLNTKMTENPALPGVGPDLVYRDPWGNPYVITIDLNDDNSCKDPFYSLSLVSGPGGNNNPGLNGLVDPDGTADNFRYHGNVMVWSAGPDGKIDPTSPAAGPNSGVNRDNILSWQ